MYRQEGGTSIFWSLLSLPCSGSHFCVSVGMVSVGAHAHGRRTGYQKTRGWKEASSHWEVTCESLPRAGTCWRLMVLLNLQELINLGHKKAPESVWSHQRTPVSAVVYNSDLIQEGDGCYMQTKTTGLNTRLENQGTPRAPQNPLVCQYEPLCLRNQLGLSLSSSSQQVTGSMCAHSRE